MIAHVTQERGGLWDLVTVGELDPLRVSLDDGTRNRVQDGSHEGASIAKGGWVHSNPALGRQGKEASLHLVDRDWLSLR